MLTCPPIACRQCMSCILGSFCCTLSHPRPHKSAAPGNATLPRTQHRRGIATKTRFGVCSQVAACFPARVQMVQQRSNWLAALLCQGAHGTLLCARSHQRQQLQQTSEVPARIHNIGCASLTVPLGRCGPRGAGGRLGLLPSLTAGPGGPRTASPPCRRMRLGVLSTDSA